MNPPDKKIPDEPGCDDWIVFQPLMNGDVRIWYPHNCLLVVLAVLIVLIGLALIYSNLK